MGAEVNTVTQVRYKDQELRDQTLLGQTANMNYIGTRTVEIGRFFSDLEELHGARVCVIGDALRAKLFGGANPAGQVVRVGKDEFTVIGAFERIGSVLGQEQDNFLVVPLTVFLRIQGPRRSVTIQAKAPGGEPPSTD